MFGSKNARRIELELVHQRINTLEAEIRSAVLEVADVYDKVYHALKRLEQRQKREAGSAPVEKVDEVSARVRARRQASGLHDELPG